LEQLKATDHIYPCFCTAEQLQAEREEAQREGRAPRYSGRCRHIPREEADRRIEAGEAHVYRLRVAEAGETTVRDLIRGDVVFQNSEIDDFIIWKADGTPTYHFASCVDDAAMEISHVIRAEEHLSNTPRHVALFQAFGVEVPLFAHVPMILAPDRSKLSKRHGATSVSEYREAGILPEALVNYLLLLGFSPGEDKEIVSRDEAVQLFQLDRVTKHAAIYDVKKLEWLNAHYFRSQSPDAVVAELWPTWVESGYVRADEVDRSTIAWIRTVTEFVLSRSRNWTDVMDGVRPYFAKVDTYDAKGVQKQFSGQDVPHRLRLVADRLQTVAPFTTVVIERAFRELIEELQVKGGELIHPTRLALTGMTVGPGLFDVMALLGREASVQRLNAAADLIERGELVNLQK
jgi:glutamyl-tRNA synthetase